MVTGGLYYLWNRVYYVAMVIIMENVHVFIPSKYQFISMQSRQFNRSENGPLKSGSYLRYLTRRLVDNINQ